MRYPSPAPAEAGATPPPKRRAWGFTLVELLVVVAVLSILMGVLLPALGRARSSARQAECMSNIRQLQLANDLYASDQDDRYMPAAAEIRRSNLHRWHGVRDAPGQPFESRGAPLTPYLEGDGASRTLRACPSFEHQLEHLTETGAGFESGCGGYGCNAAFVGSVRQEASPGVWTVETDLVGSRRSRFRGPARTVAFGDGALATDRIIEYSFIEPPRWPHLPRWRPDPSIHFRHMGLASIAWLDGHVSSETMSHSESSGFYALEAKQVGIGWFGDAQSNELFDYE